MTKRWFPVVMAAAAMWITGCDGCGDGGETPDPAAAEGTGQASESGFVPFGADTVAEEAPEPEEPPGRPAFVHDEAPSVSDFATTPVTGSWTVLGGNLQRSGMRDVRPITEPEVVWSIEVGIQGYANTPLVLEDGSVYVSSQGNRWNNRDRDPRDDRNGVYRLDPRTGAILWHVHTEQDANGMALSGDTLVVGTDSGEVLAIDRNEGEVLWRQQLECGVTSAPLIDGDRVVVYRRDRLATLSLATGEVVGEPLGECRNGERGWISVDGDTWYVSYSRRALEVREDGELLWAIDSPTEEMGGWDGWQPPIVTSSMFVQQYHRWPFGNPSERGSRRPGVVAFWRDNGQVAWAIDVNEPSLTVDDRRLPSDFLRANPWIVGDRMLYTPTNRPEVVAYSVVDGSVVDTLEMPDCRRRQFASMAGTPTMAYLPRHDGVLYGIRPDPLAIAWRITLGMHGAAGLRETQAPVDGAECGAAPLDSTALFSTPAIGPDGTVYIGAGDGWIYALRDANWE